MPVLVSVYIEEHIAPPTKAVIYSRIPFWSRTKNTVSHILFLIWLGPSHQQDDFTGFQCAYSLYHCQYKVRGHRLSSHKYLLSHLIVHRERFAMNDLKIFTKIIEQTAKDQINTLLSLGAFKD